MSASGSQDKEGGKTRSRPIIRVLLRLLSSRTILIYRYKLLLARHGRWKKTFITGLLQHVWLQGPFYAFSEE